MTTANPNIESLLHHQNWVRALARSLVADPARAEDVAQQTMLEAIGTAPRDLRRPKAWLAQVARNAAAAFARSDRRRVNREQVVAKSGTTHADSGDAADRAAAHKSVVDALFELEEPYHTVVLLRFFDDLEPKQIAAQVGRSVSTVRTQLQRGLAQLRDKLDQRFGDRSAWFAAFLPLFTRKQLAAGVPVLAITGSLAMWKILMPVVALLAALLVGMETWWTDADPLVPSSDSAVAAVEVATTAVGKPERLAVTTNEQGEQESIPAPPVPAGGGLHARVVTPDGAAIVGLTIAYHDPRGAQLVGRRLRIDNTSMNLDQPGLRDMLSSPEGIRKFAQQYGRHAKDVAALLSGDEVERPRAVSDGFGHFSFADDLEASCLRIEQNGLMIYGTGTLPGDDRTIFVAGPAVKVAGNVTDEHGTALKGVYVSMGMTLASLPGIGHQLESGAFQSWNAQSSAAGFIDMGLVPQHSAMELYAQKRGFAGLGTKTTDIHGPVKWVLQTKLTPNRKVLKGIVRRANGQPAVKASIVFGGSRGVSDDSGRFEVEVRYMQGNEDLLAYARDVQPVILQGFAQRLAKDPSLADNIVLDLGPSALSISGRVVDASGSPIRNAQVLLGDGVANGNAYQWIENSISNQRSKGEETDRAGRFTLKGLSDRSYNVRAIDKDGIVVLESGPVPAGTSDLVLRIPEQPHRHLEGVLVDGHGVAVAGAKIRLTTHLVRTANGGNFETLGETTVSGTDGHFVIEKCPLEHVEIWINGPGVKSIDLDVPTDEGPTRIVVQRVFKFGLRVTGGSTADHFAVLDAKGNRMTSIRHSPEMTSGNRVHKIVLNNGPFYEVDDQATHLLLLKGEQEVRRMPLNLRGVELNVIDI